MLHSVLYTRMPYVYVREPMEAFQHRAFHVYSESCWSRQTFQVKRFHSCVATREHFDNKIMRVQFSQSVASYLVDVASFFCLCIPNYETNKPEKVTAMYAYANARNKHFHVY